MAMAEPALAGAGARVAALFTGRAGAFRFARWGRPLAPMIHGTNDEGVRIFEDALGAVAGLAGPGTAEIDPELGANFLVFFCRDWGELAEVPSLARLLPGLGGLLATLAEAGANQYRVVGFDGSGAIRACITLMRYDADLRRVPARTLAMSQSVRGLLLWGDDAFAPESPIALVRDEAGGPGRCIVKPWFAALLRAAYDPAIPAASSEPALALRLAARLAVAGFAATSM